MAVKFDKLPPEIVSLDKFYRFLAAQRAHILEKFNDENISDDKYFKSGIAYDIVNNTLSIILNVATGSNSSIGIDSCARTIIEAFVIREIDEKGLITDEMKQIYRLSYSAVEADNERRLDAGEVFCPDEAQRKKDFDDLTWLLCQRFNCKRKQLLKSNALNSPYLFLIRTLDNRVNFWSIAKTYHVDTSKFDDAYNFFSIMIHPKQLTVDEEEELKPAREKYLHSLFDYIIDFVSHNLEHVEYDKIISIRSQLMFIKNTCIEEDRKVVALFNKAHKFLNERTLQVVFSYLHEACDLVSDMLICYYFKFYDLVTPKYKAFIEKSSVLQHFLDGTASPKRDYEMMSFFLGTYYRCEKWLPQGKGNEKEIDEYIQKAYDDYYGKAYSVNGINGFRTNLKEQLLYFMKDKNYSLWDLVRAENKVIEGETWGRNIRTLYDVAIDMQHASGYAFNQSADEAEYYATLSLLYIYDYLSSLLSGLEDNMKRNNDKFDGFTGEIRYLNSLVDKYSKIADQIVDRNKT